MPDTRERGESVVPIDAGAGRTPRSGRSVLIAVVTVAVLVSLVAIVALLRDGREAREPKPETVRADVPGATRVVDGVPVGYSRTRQGAVAAATNYLVAYNSAAVYADPGRRAAILRAMTDPAVTKKIQGDLDRAIPRVFAGLGLAEERDPIGAGFVARTIPIGYRVESYSVSQAVISIWNIGLTGVAAPNSRFPVRETWQTNTVTLRWTRGDWKWVGGETREGPAPVGGRQTPASIDEIRRAVRDFQEYVR